MAGGFEAVRDYAVRRPWLSPEEKTSLDRAYDEITSYDRLSVRVREKQAPAWLPAFLTRAAIWAGLPVVVLLIWWLISLIRH